MYPFNIFWTVVFVVCLSDCCYNLILFGEGTPPPVPGLGIFASTGTFVSVPASAVPTVPWPGSRGIDYLSISCATCVTSSREFSQEYHRKNPSMWEIIYIHGNLRGRFSYPCTYTRKIPRYGIGGYSILKFSHFNKFLLKIALNPTKKLNLDHFDQKRTKTLRRFY